MKLVGALALTIVALGSSAWAADRPFFADDTLKLELERRAVQYFIDNSNPTTGLTRDRAENFAAVPEGNRVASIASTGFSLSVIAHASTTGLVSREFAEAYVLKTLKFARDHVPRRKGWFLHFIDWETAERRYECEYSTIDTALFMGGALYAAQVFKDNPDIYSIAHGLYNDLDFIDAMTNSGALPNKRTITMAYFIEDGFTDAQWDGYAEQRLLLILGLGHPTHPLPPEAWQAWTRSAAILPKGQVAMGLPAALFIHQYSELYIDFRKFNDGYRNYFDNGRLLTEFQRLITKNNMIYRTFTSGFWGMSAGDSPNGYKVWNPTQYTSTICMGCAIGSAMFIPDVVMTDAQTWLDSPYKNHIWGRYGFSDSLDVDQGWFDDFVLGITVGPEYMSLVNTNDATSIWKDFMQIPEIQRGLDRAAASQGTVSNVTNGTLPTAK